MTPEEAAITLGLEPSLVSGYHVHTLPSIFLNSFQETDITTHFSDDEGCHEFQLVCHCEVEDEDTASGFPVALCGTAIQPPIDIVIEVFSSFELLIFPVFVDVLDVPCSLKPPLN